jgi:hypothetical protein
MEALAQAMNVLPRLPAEAKRLVESGRTKLLNEVTRFAAC